jgi:hypothetical protein
VKVTEVLKVFSKLEMEIREGRDTIAKFRHQGRVVTWSRVSHGRGEVAGKVPYYIRQQLKVDEESFQKLVDCTYWRKDYERILKAKHLI